MSTQQGSKVIRRSKGDRAEQRIQELCQAFETAVRQVHDEKTSGCITIAAHIKVNHGGWNRNTPKLTIQRDVSETIPVHDD